jgi:hypothetical protein
MIPRLRPVRKGRVTAAPCAPGDQRPIIRRRSGFMEMDNTTFGLTMLICGMGGTLLTLWIMSLVMTALGRLFPEKAEPKKEG